MPPRHALWIALLVSVATVRRWLRNSGVNGAHAMRYLLLGLVGAPLLGLAAGLWLAPKLQGAWPTELALLATAGLSIGIACFVVLLKAMDLEASDAARGIAALPLGGRLRAFCVYAPLLAVFAVVALAATPSLVVVLDHVGDSRLGVALSVVFLNVHALCWGLSVVGVAQLAVRKTRLPVGATYPFVVLLLAASLVAGYLRARRLGSGDDGGAGGWLADAALGSPAIYRLATELSLEAFAAVALGLVLAAVVALRLTIRPAGATAGALAEPHPPVRLVWSASRVAPLTSLQLLRLLRNRHVMGSAGFTVALMLVSLWYVHRLGAADVDVGRSVLLPLSVAMGHVCLAARGLTPRHRPYPVTLGLPPGRFAASVVASAFLFAFLPWFAFVGALAAVLGDALTLAIGVGLGAFVLGVAATLGSILVPGRENAGGELAGLFLTAVATIASVQLLRTLGVTGDGPIAAALLLGGLALALLPSVVEHVRWRRDLGLS